MPSFKKVGDSMLHSDNLIYTFLRSIVASQAGSWVDLFSGFALFSWIGLTPFLSTALGALLGGVVNCIINYKFTYHADGCSWKAVIVKYTMVWIGSMLLNSFGTQIAYYALYRWEWLASIGFNDEGCFAVARLGVSLVVSLFWNFLLQRYFVYRVCKFDPFAISAVNWAYHFFRRKNVPD